MWDKIRAGLQRFMAGRYGVDELNKVILAATLAVCMLGMFIRQMWISIIYWVLLALLIFRMFSRNTAARWKANERFLGFIKYIKALFTQGRDYRIFRCSKCSRIIRVPRRHGRVEVTCPECGEKRIVDTGRKA